MKETILIYYQPNAPPPIKEQASEVLLKGSLQGHNQHQILVCHKGVFILEHFVCLPPDVSVSRLLRASPETQLSTVLCLRFNVYDVVASDINYLWSFKNKSLNLWVSV